MIMIHDLLAWGYKEFPVPPYKLADQAFQRCIWDGTTKVYYVTAWYYDHTKWPHWQPSHPRDSIEFDVQFYVDEKREGFMDIQYHPASDQTIDDVEAFFAKLWDKMSRVPYESID